MDELLPYLQPLLDVLGAKHGWFAAAAGWIGTARVLMKPVSKLILSLIERWILFVQSTADHDDDDQLERLVRSKGYRLLAFWLDYLASVKLPLTLPGANLSGDSKPNTQ